LATVEDIFVTSEGSKPMQRATEIEVSEGRGIEGDRYAEGAGFWTQYGDVCEVTLIQGEHLDEIAAQGLAVRDGEHRRNIVVRGVDLLGLRGREFRVGEATVRFDRSRPPCRHVQDMSEPGMTRALRNRGGICVRVVEGGTIRIGDEVEVP
jgi:MOSC domain-containing protein YiiM